MSLKQAEGILPNYIVLSHANYSEELQPNLVRLEFEDGDTAQRKRMQDPITLRKVSVELSLENYKKFRKWVMVDLDKGSKSFLFIPPFRPNVDLTNINLPYTYQNPNADVKIGRIVGGRYTSNMIGTDDMEVQFTIESLGD